MTKGNRHDGLGRGHDGVGVHCRLIHNDGNPAGAGVEDGVFASCYSVGSHGDHGGREMACRKGDGSGGGVVAW